MSQISEISYVIPTLNSAATLDMTLLSLRSQKYVEVNIIVNAYIVLFPLLRYRQVLLKRSLSPLLTSHSDENCYNLINNRFYAFKYLSLVVNCRCSRLCVIVFA